MGRMNGLVIFGAIIAIVGLLAYAIPSFTTEQTKDVANIGDLKLQTTESTRHFVPPLVAGGAIALGIVLVGVGAIRRA